MCSVAAVDVIHRDPELALELAAVVDPDDVWMPHLRGELSLAVEAQPVVVVGCQIRWQHLDCIQARQPRMLRQVDLAHGSRAESPHNGVLSKVVTLGQRHLQIVVGRTAAAPNGKPPPIRFRNATKGKSPATRNSW